MSSLPQTESNKHLPEANPVACPEHCINDMPLSKNSNPAYLAQQEQLAALPLPYQICASSLVHTGKAWFRKHPPVLISLIRSIMLASIYLLWMYASAAPAGSAEMLFLPASTCGASSRSAGTSARTGKHGKHLACLRTGVGVALYSAI